MALDIGRELAYIKQIPGIGNKLGAAFERLVDGLNQLGKHVGADPKGTQPAPPPIQALTVKSNGSGLVHAVISDNNPINKSLHYFVEYDTDPNFTQPHVAHLGASRSMPPTILPAMDDNGKPQVFHFRAYSQYPGSEPGPAVLFGGESPTPVNPGGSTQLTLIPSTGSGTAQSSGQQGASGFGKVLVRPAANAAKRQA